MELDRSRCEIRYNMDKKIIKSVETLSIQAQQRKTPNIVERWLKTKNRAMDESEQSGEC